MTTTGTDSTDSPLSLLPYNSPILLVPLELLLLLTAPPPPTIIKLWDLLNIDRQKVLKCWNNLCDTKGTRDNSGTVQVEYKC